MNSPNPDRFHGRAWPALAPSRAFARRNRSSSESRAGGFPGPNGSTRFWFSGSTPGAILSKRFHTETCWSVGTRCCTTAIRDRPWGPGRREWSQKSGARLWTWRAPLHSGPVSARSASAWCPTEPSIASRPSRTGSAWVSSRSSLVPPSTSSQSGCGANWRRTSRSRRAPRSSLGSEPIGGMRPRWVSISRSVVPLRSWWGSLSSTTS